ncbi:MAG: DUF3099 domain-containing protein [Candidatus Nanopelagicales bacterium]
MSLPTPFDAGRGPVVRRDTEVHSVTSAQTPLSQEQRARTKRYLISMSIRTACFLGAVIAQGWLRWALLAGAVFLPYIAVVMANAGRENDPMDGPQAVPPADVTGIEGRRPGIGT